MKALCSTFCQSLPFYITTLWLERFLQKWLAVLMLGCHTSSYRRKWDGDHGNHHYLGYPENIYLFKVTHGNSRKRYETYSKLIMKTPEQCQLRRSGVFIVNFEYISLLFILFLCLTLTRKQFLGRTPLF